MASHHTDQADIIDTNLHSKNSNSPNSLPIIDLSLLEHPDKREEFYRDLAYKAREIGFFYLIGHGVTPAEFRSIEAQARHFFSLPLQSKEQINMVYSPHFRGYTAVGFETTRNHPDNREQIDIGAELPELTLLPDSPSWLRLQGPNQWPINLPHFKDIVLNWQNHLRSVAIRLLHALMIALEQPEDALDDLITGTPAHLLKLIHYPGSAQKEHRQGVGAHKDNGILTLLLQDDVGGLQVETNKGWIDIPPLENAFIINIGEVLELATNGYLRANMHRVITPKQGIERHSIAYFLSPRLAANQVPLLRLPKHLANLATGPESDPLNPLFNHVGTNTFKSRLRSHLNVSKKFYPKEYQQLVEQAGGENNLQPTAY